MTRYTSVDDITTALVELEEKERLAKNAANGVEENGTDNVRMGIGDSDSYSDRSSIKEADELLSEGNDDGSESVNGDDEDEDAGPGRSEEDEVAVRKKRTEVDPAEMEDFDREMKAMLQVRFCDPGFPCTPIKAFYRSTCHMPCGTLWNIGVCWLDFIPD